MYLLNSYFLVYEWQPIGIFRLDAFSVRKGNFLKYKNQYFFYKKTGFTQGSFQRKGKL
jgi:hypothetical protein